METPLKERDKKKRWQKWHGKINQKNYFERWLEWRKNSKKTEIGWKRKKSEWCEFGRVKKENNLGKGRGKSSLFNWVQSNLKSDINSKTIIKASKIKKIRARLAQFQL